MYLFFIETKKKLPPSCCRSLTNFITLCCNEYTSPLARFELTMLVVIGTDYIDSYKYNSLHRLTSVCAIKVFGQSLGWKICSKIALSNVIPCTWTKFVSFDHTDLDPPVAILQPLVLLFTYISIRKMFWLINSHQSPSKFLENYDGFLFRQSPSKFFDN